MKKTILIPALLFTLGAAAQDNMFVVYSIKGAVSVIENKTETKAKIGTILDGDETIRVGTGSFATLICNENRAFSINKAGNYSTASLKDSCKISGGSVSSNYMKYVWDEMTKPKGTPEKNRKNYMANVGAVSRGINNVWIDPRLDTINYVSGTVPLSWKSYTDAEEFEFKLYDESGSNTLFSKAIKKKHVDISELLKTIQPGKSYKWTAMIKGEPDNDDKKFLHYAPKEEYNTFYNRVKSHDAAETEAGKNFRIGFILEENHYLAEAYNHYMKATQLDPANSLYRYTFMSFKKDYEIK
ncbi:MAG TPA: hypothetical protein VJ765_09860 [Chitinophagaceae bacterium]|nr:hypothetical protein [Chitinophagaceae bacterium]